MNRRGFLARLAGVILFPALPPLARKPEPAPITFPAPTANWGKVEAVIFSDGGSYARVGVTSSLSNWAGTTTKHTLLNSRGPKRSRDPWRAQRRGFKR